MPSHTWVEVMRISRIADQDRKWAQADLSTIGQVWFFLSPGGIWWNTGRSLVINTTVSTETTLWDRVRATLRGGRRTISPLSATACTSPAQVNMWWARRNAEFRLATCTRARAAGYDSMQLTSSFCGFSFELVDCRGAERFDAEQTWTSACPPTHIQLMSGLPTPRVAPALELASGPAYACLCAGRHSFLNCAARSPARHGPSSPRPAAASAGALAGAVRHYLGLVYPAAKLDDASNEAVLERFNSLHFYYEPLVSRSTILAAATRKHQSWPLLPLDTRQQVCMKPVRGIVRDLFADLLPCTGLAFGGRGGCLERQHNFRTEWVADVSGEDQETWLEVIHASRGGKREAQDKQSLTWADFIDPGPAGIWFHYAKGSGIFYRSGRTLVSPAKNAALASLFAEASRTAAVAERWTPAGFVESKLVDSSYKARNLAWLTEQMHLTSRGMRNCTQAGLRGFRTPYIVQDDWDSVMVWLARQLAYDTIFLTASLCCTPDVTNQCGVAELVDVRIPKTVLSDGQLSMPKPAMGSFLRKPMDTLPMSAYTSKSTDLSRSWAKGLYASHTLTLRDPWDVANSNRSQACRFLQEIRGWLSCDGHLPSMLIADDSTIAGSLIRNLAWPSVDPIAP